MCLMCLMCLICLMFHLFPMFQLFPMFRLFSQQQRDAHVAFPSEDSRLAEQAACCDHLRHMGHLRHLGSPPHWGYGLPIQHEWPSPSQTPTGAERRRPRGLTVTTISCRRPVIVS